MQDPYNGKVLLAAVICLSVVILFVILLHLYGRWLLHRSRTAHTNSVLTDFHLRRRSSVDETAAVAVSSRDSGLDSTAVAALPIFVYDGKEQNGKIVDCVVCLSVMEEGEKGRILPRCGHGFHVRCIDVWLMGNSTCPICRAPAVEEEDCEVVVVVESNDGVGEVSEVAVVEMEDVEKEESSSSSTTTTMVGGSLKRMLSRSRSDKRVFPSVLEN
ncbi:RING-H2 finger protein ATL63-like [Dendrobium catenatum]|uniref:RING-H2 finger protein ATL5 n=1 Tax=Dendrobium catenatum TaxID=906689 RepID=A0A2I0VXL5_9ASPA|nr:RING-H2 finger protein ATL63-like [Dendrobium catenatum]PKU68146.1 RING-H2 finger protein ATL5 [Dendrobium catenatum]